MADARLTSFDESDTRELARTLAPLEDCFTKEPGATMRPKDPALSSAGARALARLVETSEARDHGRGGALVIGRTLGEGGMGIVHMATQVSLGRQVAAKTLRSGIQSEESVLRLLREAWITGSLEHPNVVPVHDLSVGADGSPQLVLKRVEGARWLELIADSEATRETYGAEDHLEWNLRILISVMRALELAHSRRIVHRDIKPENVMIGRFGEVYLMDWGLAASLDPDPSGRLPTIGATGVIAGTPAYMAPEMVGGGAAHIDERTDVYLLGATLYEVLTGAAPHHGRTLIQIVGSIMRSEVELPDTVPRSLASVVQKAMTRSSAERFASVSQMRETLEAFLAHRPSIALATRAQATLAELEALTGDTARPEPDQTETYELFNECRFGFRQALDIWSKNEAASRGLSRACELLVRYEIANGDVLAAEKALAELDEPPPALTVAVDAAREQRHAEQRRIDELEALSRDLDPDVGRRQRTIAALVLGVGWVIGPIIGGYRTMVLGRVQDANELLVWPAVLVVAVGLVGLAGRRALAQTAINRRLILGLLFAMGALLLFHLGMLIAGLPPPLCQVMDHFLWFCVSAGMVGFVDRRLWPTAVGYLIAFFLAAADPDLRWITMTLANLTFVINVVALRGPSPERVTSTRRGS